MSLLFRTLFAWKCRSTHHKLAMDALTLLRGPQSEEWRNLFLSQIEPYLEGAKAPDDRFKDFRNHVLHVRENNWGGAVPAAKNWYAQTLEALRAGTWSTAVYRAGVLSHYVTDPVQPLHTAQCDAEGNIHRALEWSITCSYDELRRILVEEQGGFPAVAMPAGPDWIDRLVLDGAALANPEYQPYLDRYDFNRGVKDPPAGLDRKLQEITARLIGQAAARFALVLDRALTESQAEPPRVSVTLNGVLTGLTVPIFFITKKMADAKERAAVLETYRELQATGRVVETLSADDRTVRKLHTEEVLGITVDELDLRNPAKPPQVAGKAAAEPKKPIPSVEPKKATLSAVVAPERNVPNTRVSEAPVARVESATARVEAASSTGSRSPRFHLELESPVVDAPSIGPKIADRLHAIGILTVSDLIDADPDAAAARLNVRHITDETIREWQDQAVLVIRIPGLRGHDAQILTACGIAVPSDLAAARADDLKDLVDTYVSSPDGQRMLRSSSPPDDAEIRDWIKSAAAARDLPGRSAAA